MRRPAPPGRQHHESDAAGKQNGLVIAGVEKREQLLRTKTNAHGVDQWMEIDLLGSHERCIENAGHLTFSIVHQCQWRHCSRSDPQNRHHLLGGSETELPARSDVRGQGLQIECTIFMHGEEKQSSLPVAKQQILGERPGHRSSQTFPFVYRAMCRVGDNRGDNTEGREVVNEAPMRLFNVVG